METVTISRNELKKIMQETFIDVLTKRKDLIEDAVLDAIEDIGMGVAIEAGRTREYVNVKDFLRKLDSRIKRSKGTSGSTSHLTKTLIISATRTY